jgi:AcrR family transcriptional regulator
VAEGQDWTFSLREVAGRAGVSHNAPYNHVGDKQDLLVAIAGAGFARLHERMAASVAGIAAANKASLHRKRTGIIERDLFGRTDDGIRTDARRPIQLVNIRTVLVELIPPTWPVPSEKIITFLRHSRARAAARD